MSGQRSLCAQLARILYILPSIETATTVEPSVSGRAPNHHARNHLEPSEAKADTTSQSEPKPYTHNTNFFKDSSKLFNRDQAFEAMGIDLGPDREPTLDVLGEADFDTDRRQSQSKLDTLLQWFRDINGKEMHHSRGDGSSGRLLSSSVNSVKDTFTDTVLLRDQASHGDRLESAVASHPATHSRTARAADSLRSDSAKLPIPAENEPKLFDTFAKQASNFTDSITSFVSESLQSRPNSTNYTLAGNANVAHNNTGASSLTNATLIANERFDNVLLNDQPESSFHSRHPFSVTSSPQYEDAVSTMEPFTDATSETTSFPGYINVNNISFEDDDKYTGSGGLFSGSGFLGSSGLDLANLTVGCADWLLSNGTCVYDNVTNSTNTSALEGPTGPPEARFWTLFLLIFPMFTVFGNILVVLSVYKERSLRTVTNYFIVSLAIADIMVAVLVMPLAVYVEVYDSFWTLGDALCDTWVAFDVMCCTASILNLTAISVDRFIAVTQPIKYAKHKNSNRVYVMLALTWIVSIAISSPIALGMNYTERRSDTPNLCIFYNSDFLIYSSMGSFYIPCLIMVLLYWRIFRAIRLRARKAAKQKKLQSGSDALKFSVIENKAQTGKTTSDASATEDSCHKELLPAKNSSAHARSLRPAPIAEETSFTNFNAKLHSTTENSGEEDSHSQSHSHSHSQGEGAAVGRPVIGNNDDAHVISNDRSTDYVLSPTSDDNVTVSANHRYRDAEAGYSAPTLVEVESNLSGNVTSPTTQKTLLSPPPRRAQMSPGVGVKNHIPGKKLKRNNNKSSPKKSVTKFNFHLHRHHSKKKKEGTRCSNRRERKATKTLAIVLGVFLLCWVPFFTVNIMNAICIRFDLFRRPECNINSMLFSFFVWLGYINSFLNPVIYTIFNIEFRRAFKKLLRQPCK